MTIQHTLVFRLVHPPGSDEEADFLAAACETLTSIPGVTDFTVNRQVSAKSELRHQFTMVFADQAVYDAYDTHPAHVGFVEDRWIPKVAAFQEYDFTVIDLATACSQGTHPAA